jgi:hypothetical protein
MSDIKRMPADDCRHHCRGRCLYEERLNPGYQRNWRCGVMMQWEAAFDDFLHRAEAFSVGPEQVGKLWKTRFERLVGHKPDCPKFQADASGVPPFCRHHHDALCLLGLERCEGRCRRFAPMKEDAEET